ncbi:tail protein X [Geovibrio ferrireducens]|uniref:tail protein X n=1 Tax=Geovibrio ferrireducens TaxID=46201 RepID=UPI002246B2A8|nr:tail protein X [Geovibrio ferrireducens]
MRKTISIQGDLWDTISLRELGEERFMSALLEVNPAIAHIVVFSGGTEVNIPELEVLPSTPILPPWKVNQ